MTMTSLSPAPQKPSLYLHEADPSWSEPPNLFAKLNHGDQDRLRRISTPMSFQANEDVFIQGERHSGIFVILSGQVRTYYTGPSGREITLAFWSPGNFVGGPEIFGGGQHIWSARAVGPARVLHVQGRRLRALMSEIPNLAIAIIEALEHKGKCYSAMIHMLGTRSVAERLAQLLLLMAERDGRQDREGIAINKRLTHDDLAKMVGATRQWVTMTIDRFAAQGMIRVRPTQVVITDLVKLRRLAGYGSENEEENLEHFQEKWEPVFRQEMR